MNICRDAIGKCGDCTAELRCGYCASTMQCLSGNEIGPENGIPCPEWIFNSNSCPVMPPCADYADCISCAANDMCAWCASDNVCVTVSDSFTRDCRGTVFDLPCPNSFVSENVIIGNVVIQPDPTFGGGNFSVTGMMHCFKTIVY